MAQYKSKFKELGFYVDGELKRFSNGVYITVDKAEIAVLDTLQDVQAAEQAKAEPKAEVKAEQPKATTKPKAPAKK